MAPHNGAYGGRTFLSTRYTIVKPERTRRGCADDRVRKHPGNIRISHKELKVRIEKTTPYIRGESYMKNDDKNANGNLFLNGWFPQAQFYAGCIILARLAVTSSGYMIAFLAWSIIYCTVVTIVFLKKKK